MRQIELVKKDVDLVELNKREALPKDYSKEISGDFIGLIDGKPAVCLVSLNENLDTLVKSLDRVNYAKDKRISGLIQQSRVIGFQPASPAREYGKQCSVSLVSREYPEEHGQFIGLAQKMSDLYKAHMPEDWMNQNESLKKEVLSDWIIPETCFTSGIINKNSQLKYHFDSGNFPGFKSVMLVVKKNMHGGDLCLPEYDLKITLNHGQVLIFDGQSILHGVTPIHRMANNSFRYSVVFYALKNMCKCLSIDEELKKAKALYTQVQKNRINA